MLHTNGQTDTRRSMLNARSLCRTGKQLISKWACTVYQCQWQQTKSNLPK